MNTIQDAVVFQGLDDTKSLPWTASTNPKDWNTRKADYDTRRLADDTLALLSDQTPVIARMETLRRAALYGRKNAAAPQ